MTRATAKLDLEDALISSCLLVQTPSYPPVRKCGEVSGPLHLAKRLSDPCLAYFPLHYIR